jgi:hypothetical protein
MNSYPHPIIARDVTFVSGYFDNSRDNRLWLYPLRFARGCVLPLDASAKVSIGDKVSATILAMLPRKGVA